MPRIFIKKEEEKVNKEFELNTGAYLTVKNLNGSISILENSKSENNKIVIEATKYGTQEELKNSSILFKNKTDNFLIETEIKNKDNQACQVNYIIKVPKNIILKLVKINNGFVKIENFSGPINSIIIDKGNLSILSPENIITNIKINNGNIMIDKPKKSISNIIVNRGNIEIFDSVNSVIAKTNIGSIKIKQKIFKEPFTLFLETIKGSVSLNLPKDLQAHVIARTLRGRIHSAYPISFKSVTMKLNEDNWGQLKRNIEGIIGDGGSPITIDVSKGNITLDIY